jgi:hypothetical protein
MNKKQLIERMEKYNSRVGHEYFITSTLTKEYSPAIEKIAWRVTIFSGSKRTLGENFKDACNYVGGKITEHYLFFGGS